MYWSCAWWCLSICTLTGYEVSEIGHHQCMIDIHIHACHLVIMCWSCKLIWHPLVNWICTCQLIIHMTSMYMDDQLAYPIGYHDHPYTITCHCICQITCGYDMVTYYELHVIHIPQVHSMTCHHISMFMIWQVDNMFSLWSSISYRDRPWSYIWMIWS